MNNIFEIIIKIEKNNTNEMSDVLNEMFEQEWMSNELLWIDFIILHDFRFDIPFRKM